MSDPTLIATLPKNRRQEIRVRIGTYKGHRFADVRIFSDPPSDRSALGRVPTRRGVAVAVDALPDLINALRKAYTTEMHRRRAEAANENRSQAKTSRKARP
ncbi:hypothetical protein [Azospirillum rugosum]|uniref:Transcriptional Coactivator p15 (PC4) n=1 Tax=Azospirillum rugosum TaxID=416170 RepID=A0ABS4SRY7_9PROT|nr:hypothetical protein [Azospirillum rugosum]MBP2294712.1 hypothetical protein [Azospirillum rugosum]MDQ0527999.1 hypothetical protein [Azospirillum rugosum]